jgi:ABC-type Fe3+-hydroxamate transport system substrate-binding protein
MRGLLHFLFVCRSVGMLVLLCSLIVSACSNDASPTAGEAARTLKSHILQLLEQRNAQEVTVTDPGGAAIPCGEGKVKRTFAATGKDLPERGPETLRSMLLGTVESIAPYSIVEPHDFSHAIRVSSDTSRTVLILDSPADGTYLVRGETECLMP